MLWQTFLRPSREYPPANERCTCVPQLLFAVTLNLAERKDHMNRIWERQGEFRCKRKIGKILSSPPTHSSLLATIITDGGNRDELTERLILIRNVNC
jgi:hypothetical protein